MRSSTPRTRREFDNMARWASRRYPTSSAAELGKPIEETLEPEGGYTLYLPRQQAGRKPPLLVWLHPAGAERNQLATRWWPELSEMGWALMLPESKTPKNWGMDEDKTVLRHIEAAAKKHEVDAGKVVLLGFSAGGQMAFYTAWKHPERIAGVVTMSAVPVKSARDLSAPIPAKEHAASLAYFMVVGEQEELATRIATCAQLELVCEGFSARLQIVKEAGHAFHESEKKDVLAWLDEVAAGRRPAAEQMKELAKTAPERLKAEKAELDRALEPYRRDQELRGRVFDTIKENLGKPYTLEWKPAGQVEQAGKLSIILPEGWTVGEVDQKEDSSAFLLAPPNDQHIVIYLGRSVKTDGFVEHYRKWFDNMSRENVITRGESGVLAFNGRDWQIYTFLVVPRAKKDDPVALRQLVFAVHPLNEAGTEWRSLSVMCPRGDCADNKVAEIIRGILEKSNFGAPAKKAE
jgi:predicted esterase